jgi:hypothetical protein
MQAPPYVINQRTFASNTGNHHHRPYFFFSPVSHKQPTADSNYEVSPAPSQ